MRKVSLIFGVILILLNHSISKADWIDKGQYFEMDLGRDLTNFDFKFYDNNNKILIVDSSNHIYNVDAKTGSILNQCDNFQNINSDKVLFSENGEYVYFLTKYSIDKFYTYTYKINIIEYKNCKIEDTLSIDTKKILKYINLSDSGLEDYKFNVTQIKLNQDTLNLFTSLFYYKTESNSANNKSNNSEIVFKFIKKDNQYIFVTSYSKQITKSIYFLNNYNKLAYNDFSETTSANSLAAGGGYISNIYKSSSVYLLDSSKKQEFLINNNYQRHYDSRNNPEVTITGNYFEIYNLHQSINPDELLVQLTNEVQYFDLKTNKRTKSIYSPICKDNLLFLKKIPLILQHRENKIFSYFANEKVDLIDSLVLDVDIINQIIYEEETNELYAKCDNNKLIKLELPILNSIKNQGFYADFTKIYENTMVTFYTLNNSKNNKYLWSINDTIIESNENYISYFFNSSGEYTIELKVIDSLGNQLKFTKDKYIKVLVRPKADFSYKFDNEYKENCYFQSISKGDINKYDWDFGDSVKSNIKDPVHNFRNDGNYFVKLIVSDGTLSDTTIQEIFVKYTNYEIDKKDLSSIFKLDTIIKPEQYFITNDILKIFSNNNSSTYYPGDRWSHDYYSVNYSYLTFNLDFINFKFEKLVYNYEYHEPWEFNKFFKGKVLYLENYDFIMYNKYHNENQPYLYIHKDYKEYLHYMFNSNVIKLPYTISKQPKLLDSRINNTVEFQVVEEINGTLQLTKLNEKEVLKSQTFILDTALHQIKISQMDDRLLVVYSDSTHNYSGKLILDNQNIALFSKKKLDSTFEFTHTKLINNNLVLLGNKPKGNSTIAKIFIYNLQTKTIKDFELPILKKIEDITLFNQTLIVAGETINMTGYILFDKDFSNYKFVYNKEFLGQVKKIHIKNNVLNLVCEKQNNTKYDIYILQDTLENVTNIDNEVVVNPEILIFPNPSSEKISLDLGGVAVADLVVYDILGKEIISIPNYSNKSEINISTLSIGTYTIQVQTSTGSISQRLKVNR